MNSFFVGCGYVGSQVARRELIDGGSVGALVRRVKSAATLNSIGVDTQSVDLDSLALKPLPDLTGRVLYWFVPPPAQGLLDSRLAAGLGAIRRGFEPVRIVLVSTTGVYGDCGGEWVDESRPVNPKSDRSQRRVDAEQKLQKWCQGRDVSSVVLRVPGIYGPGKLPLKRLRAGHPVLAPQVSPWSNRVHAHDLVAACLAAARLEKPARVYNVSDDNPSSMTDFLFRVADATGLPRPPVIGREQQEEALSAGLLSYLAESKRIDNTLMREHLGVVPRYPDLATGLDDLDRELLESSG